MFLQLQSQRNKRRRPSRKRQRPRYTLLAPNASHAFLQKDVTKWVRVCIGDEGRSRAPNEEWFWIPAAYRDMIQEIQAYADARQDPKDPDPANYIDIDTMDGWTEDEIEKMNHLPSRIMNLPTHHVITTSAELKELLDQEDDDKSGDAFGVLRGVLQNLSSGE